MEPFPTPTLPLLGILIGIVLVGSHLFGLVASGFCRRIALSFPRSRTWGTALLAITSLWLLALTEMSDLGEYSPMRNLILLGIIVFSFLLWKFVPDFLSSRSLGFLLLLAAHPVLESSFLQHGFLHLAMTSLAYLWALAGLFLVGMPYLHRDLIGWISVNKSRWNLACFAGLFYGTLLLIDGLRLTILS